MDWGLGNGGWGLAGFGDLGGAGFGDWGFGNWWVGEVDVFFVSLCLGVVFEGRAPTKNVATKAEGLAFKRLLQWYGLGRGAGEAWGGD